MTKLAIIGKVGRPAGIAAAANPEQVSLDIRQYKNLQQTRKIGTTEPKRVSKHSLHKQNKCDNSTCVYHKLGK